MELPDIYLTEEEFNALPLSRSSAFNQDRCRYQCGNGQWLFIDQNAKPACAVIFLGTGPAPEPSRQDLVTELRGTDCRCGGTKRARQTFCTACYRRLSRFQQRALYSRIGAGYEETYAAAVKALFPPVKP